MANKQRGRPAHGDVLTPAEWRVVEFVRHGLTNRAIAERQQVSANAVKYHVANALAKLGLANRRELCRWDGVSAASALKGNGMDMDAAATVTGFGQIARSVSAIAAAEAWYRDVLGLAHLYTYGDMAFFELGGTRLYLQQGEAKSESILYLKVADIHAAHQVLAGKGVEFLSAPHMIHRHADGTEEWVAFFNDPDGRPLAVMAQARP
jgi:DNA-binding CsgD family transcriptional regulator/catechol 2,3-dioxygenase-like lactoylglutathione lyase family enzyme